MNFDSISDARAALKEKHADLVAAWEGVKERDNITEGDLRSDENRIRVGTDHRNGKDITAQEFQETFGFRGGEFGKWVSQGSGEKDRQLDNGRVMAQGTHEDLLATSPLYGEIIDSQFKDDTKKKEEIRD